MTCLSLGICLLTLTNSAVAQKDQPIIKFGLFADIQYGNCETNGSRFYRNSLGKLENCVRELNHQEVEFSINLGDIVDRSYGDIDSVLIYLERLERKLYNTTGNHDYKEVVDNEILYKKLKMPSAYYYFKEKNWVFIMLNTNEVASYANIAGTEKEKQLTEMIAKAKLTSGVAKPSWNGGISHQQLDWLSKLLTKCDRLSENVLIFSHHPLYPDTDYTAQNNQEILDVIGNHSCVKAIFSGHHHSGNFAYFKNIPIVTMEGMIETEKENAFAVVSIYTDRIMLDGRGRATSRTLPFSGHP